MKFIYCDEDFNHPLELVSLWVVKVKSNIYNKKLRKTVKIHYDRKMKSIDGFFKIILFFRSVGDKVLQVLSSVTDYWCSKNL